MLTLTIDCSHHQKADGGYGRQEEMTIRTIDADTATEVKQRLVARGWVVQFNGEHMDTYCSKECAR